MKRFLVLLFVFFLSGFSIYADEEIEKIYKNIERMSDVNTPDSYKVMIENKNFDEALEELPPEILEGKDRPRVVISFKKREGVKILIENIKEEYTSLFSMYEEYFKFSGISKVQNPKELREIIDRDKISVYKVDLNFVVLQAWDPTKEEKDDNYAFFYLDKKKWVISEAVYYLDGNPYVKAQNSYKSFGKYYMPYKIVLTNMNDNSSDVFLFRDYNFNN